MGKIDFDKLVPGVDLAGEDDDETEELRGLLSEAERYLGQQAWVAKIEKAYFGFGIANKLGVFLFEIEPRGAADRWLWVVNGDLPSAYMVVDSAPDPCAALEVYCTLMSAWVAAVQDGASLDGVFPVAAEPLLENAELLRKRIEFITNEVIPMCRNS